MRQPEYRFFLTEAQMLQIYAGYAIDETTGELISGFSDSYSSTSQMSVTSFDTVRLATTDFTNCKLFEYTSAGVYIGFSEVSQEEQAFIFRTNTGRIRLQFQNINAHYDTNSKDAILAGKLIKPVYKELSKKYSKESEQEFFRISLEGKINLHGADFDKVYNSSLNTKHILAVDMLSGEGAWEEYYKGEFNKADCKFDYSKKKCELKLTPLDGYTKVMNKYDNNYNLIKLAPAMAKIDLHKRSLMQVYIRGGSSVSNFFGGIYWEDDVNEEIDDGSALINKYHFAYISAGNEFYIEGAKIQEVNGVYAGINGYWSQWNGHTCYLDITAENPYNRIYIKRNSDNVVLYASVFTYTSPDMNNIYIDSENIDLVNVADASDVITISNPFVYHIHRRLLCDVDQVTDSEGTKNTYDVPSDDFVTDNRNYKKCIGLTGGSFFCTSRTVDSPTKYGMDDYGKYFTNQFIPATAGLGRPLPICRNTWANASLWYVYNNYYEYTEVELRKQYTLKDSYALESVIKALLSEIDPSIKHEGTAEYSRFFYDPVVPLSGMTRFYAHITQKTNILKGEYDQPAQKAELSLENLTKMLRDCFRCYWYIEDNKFKIEHISFFMQGGTYASTGAETQLDFTKLKDKFNKKQLDYFQSEVEYDKSELASRYEFAWMDEATDLFDGLTLDISSDYMQKDKTEEINIAQFSADIDYMLFNPSSFSDDGFALLCPLKNTSTGRLEIPIVKTSLIDENGDEYDAIVQNWYASWAYLIRFYMYDISGPDVECNAVNVYAHKVKQCMKNDIQFPSASDLDALKLITTSLGNGKIEELSINMINRQVKAKLVYTPK